jgi:HK97 family phage major capsid protein
MSDFINQQVEARAKAWEEAKSLLDSAAAEKRDLTAEENVTYGRIMEDLEARAAQIDSFKAVAEREERAAEAMKGREAEARAIEVPVSNDDAMIRSLARGEIRSMNIEKRDVLKSSTGAPVPTSFYDQIFAVARYVGPMLEVSNVLNTTSGEALQIPRGNAYSTGTVSAEAAAIGESDPSFLAFLTVNAYKESFLVQVSTEMLEDTGIDLLGYLSTNVGQALGYAANSALTIGTGTVQPTGIVTSAGSGVTGGTGVAGAFTSDNVLDLVYSTDAAVRAMPSFALMGSTTAARNLRKLKDTTGQYLWQPALVAGQPDRLAGYMFHENPHMADVATGAKSLIAGDMKSFLVRQVGGIRLDRSDDYAFNQGLVTFRATLRIDSGLTQSSHVKYFAGAAS